jgi:sugar/nucleoside kinase (ribokinase family)
MIGVGGIGTGMFFALDGDATLGRNESRPGRLLDVRDYCKLHIIAHYVAVLMRGGMGVMPIGKVGDDAAGRRLIEEMTAAGMDVRFVQTAPGLPTTLSVCFQYPDGSGGNITTGNGASASLHPRDIDSVEPVLAAHRGEFIALAAPEFSLDCRWHMLELAGRYGGLRVAAFASAEVPEALDRGTLCHVDILSVNEDEGTAFAQQEFDAARPEAFLRTLAREVRNEADGRDLRILLSAGKAGAYACESGHWYFIPALPVEVASTAGAGDALLGGTLAGMAMGLPFAIDRPRRSALAGSRVASAVDLGTILAAMSVTSPHTIHPEADLPHLRAFAKEHGIGV